MFASLPSLSASQLSLKDHQDTLPATGVDHIEAGHRSDPNEMIVLQLQRRPHPGLFSVERLFGDVRETLIGDGLDVRVQLNSFSSSGLLPRLRDAWAARRAHATVKHVTGDVHYLTWWLDKKHTVLTVLDCVGLHRMHGFRRWVFKRLWYTIPCRRSRYITVISEFTRQELLKETDCNPDRVVVIYPHLSEEFQRADKPFSTDRPRILQIGTTPNKNIHRLAQALSGLDIELIVIGRLTEDQRRSLHDAGVPLIEKHSLTRDQLVQEYASADILAFVSTYEGFGLPIIEAQAVGRPVVTSDRCSMPEVAGDAACLVDPLDVDSIRGSFERVIEDTGYRQELVDRGYENVERFRLHHVAAQYRRMYSAIAADSDYTADSAF